MDDIIVDTSAWIESFKPQCDETLAQLVRDAIIRGRILLPGIIKAELLRGTKNTKEYKRMNDLLKGLNYLAVSEEFWDRLSKFSFDLFRKGLTVPMTDTYIALLCIENNAAIIHRDRHFELIARNCPLIIFKP